jgi:hypothetical protein
MNNQKSPNAVSCSNNNDKLGGVLIPLAGTWTIAGALQMAQQEKPGFDLYKPVFDFVNNESCNW